MAPSNVLCNMNTHICPKTSKLVAEEAKPVKTQSKLYQLFHGPGTFAERVTRWRLVFGTFLTVHICRLFILPWGSYSSYSGTKGTDFGRVHVGTAALEAQGKF